MRKNNIVFLLITFISVVCCGKKQSSKIVANERDVQLDTLAVAPVPYASYRKDTIPSFPNEFVSPAFTRWQVDTIKVFTQKKGKWVDKGTYMLTPANGLIEGMLVFDSTHLRFNYSYSTFINPEKIVGYDTQIDEVLQMLDECEEIPKATFRLSFESSSFYFIPGLSLLYQHGVFYQGLTVTVDGTEIDYEVNKALTITEKRFVNKRSNKTQVFSIDHDDDFTKTIKELESEY